MKTLKKILAAGTLVAASLLPQKVDATPFRLSVHNGTVNYFGERHGDLLLLREGEEDWISEGLDHRDRDHTRNISTKLMSIVEGEALSYDLRPSNQNHTYIIELYRDGYVQYQEKNELSIGGTFEPNQASIHVVDNFGRLLVPKLDVYDVVHEQNRKIALPDLRIGHYNNRHYATAHLRTKAVPEPTANTLTNMAVAGIFLYLLGNAVLRKK